MISSAEWRREKTCRLCGTKSALISGALGVCKRCLVDKPEQALRIAMQAHERSRRAFGLPPRVPRTGNAKCTYCAHECLIPEGERGYCGLTLSLRGKPVRPLKPGEAVGEAYFDPHPTNCVAGWFCPASTGLGYPKYSYSRKGPEYGYVNLAVFYGACNLDCLYCQNWHYREMASSLSPRLSVEKLIHMAEDKRVSCVCFFGGDPSPQIAHALVFSSKVVEIAEREGRIIRICWETNGHINRRYLKRMADISLETGGIIKFDLKAWTPSVYKALTGADIGPVLENFRYLAGRMDERPEVPLLTASTLLVPGYVDVEEVEGIAGFIASLNPDIPYTLLAFHPDYMMRDLPPTSARHAEAALKAARKAGLRRVSLGNAWLLGDHY